MNQQGIMFERLCEIMQRLRAPGGCPWDREQTHASLVKYLIEESYELSEAITHQDDDEIRNELGDVLLQVVFHSAIAEEEGRFNIIDVMNGICEKMIRRHPHVFGESQVENSAEVLTQWEKIKMEEKEEGSSLLDGIPRSLPALQRAERLQSRAAKVGFDWENSVQVLAKVREELAELEQEVTDQSEQQRITEEFGDLLFAMVNWARFQKIDAEAALQACNRKFIERFRYIENELHSRGSSVHEATLAEMDALWEKSKNNERKR